MQNVPRTPIKKYKRRGSTPTPFLGDTVIEPTIASWWQDNLFHPAFISGLYLEARTYFQGRLSRSLAEKCHVFFFSPRKISGQSKVRHYFGKWSHRFFFFFPVRKVTCMTCWRLWIKNKVKVKFWSSFYVLIF